MGRLRGSPEEVEKAVRLLNVRDRRRLQRVDQVRESDCVPNEEDGDVVADEVVVPLPGVEFDRESP